MKLPLVVAVSLLPFLVSSNPINQRVGTIINLNKRFKLAKNGVVHVDTLKAHKHQVDVCVPSILTFICLH